MPVTDDIIPVAAPGPRPSAFVFPFAEAAAAVSAIGDMIDEVRSVLEHHDRAVIGATEHFHGQSARSFLQRFDGEMADLRSLIRSLEDELADLEATIQIAHERRAARDAAIAAWHQAAAAHDAYQQEMANR